jgi:hypothetical protein
MKVERVGWGYNVRLRESYENKLSTNDDMDDISVLKKSFEPAVSEGQ